MPKCSSCDGSGCADFDIGDGEFFENIIADCNHCSGTGIVDEETAFNDNLISVCYFIANFQVQEKIKSLKDPYSISLNKEIEDCVLVVIGDVVNMTREMQEILIAWHHYILSERKPIQNKQNISLFSDDDNIPF